MMSRAKESLDMRKGLAKFAGIDVTIISRTRITNVSRTFHMYTGTNITYNLHFLKLPYFK
jgi:hypothetical protein